LNNIIQIRGTGKHCIVTGMIENPPKAEKNESNFEQSVKETAAQAYVGMYVLVMTVTDPDI
jgi:hypothetical protein